MPVTYCNRIIHLIFWLLLSVNLSFGQGNLERYISIKFHNTTIQEALLELGEAADISIGFDPHMFNHQNKRIHANFINTPLDSVLTTILDSTNVDFVIKNNQIILKPNVLKKIRLTGYVSDATSREKLVRATLYDRVHNTLIITNDYGYFSVKLPNGNYDFDISYVGYQPKRIHQALNIPVSLDILLEPATYLGEVIVNEHQFKSDLFGKSLQSDISLQKINNKIGKGGENDLVQYIQTIAGVKSGADGLGGLNVRGGNFDQNTFIVDDATIFQPYHGFGLFSIFNTDAIRHVSFYKSGFPAKYGGRLSSILDIKIKEGNTQHFGYHFSTSTLMTGITADVPLKKEKAALFFAARRTHIDPFIRWYSRKQKKEKDQNGVNNFFFYDLNIKFHSAITKSNRVYLSIYNGGDLYSDTTGFVDHDIDYNVVQNQNQELKWQNSFISSRWNHIYHNSLFSNLTYTHSRYGYNSKLRQYSQLLLIDSSFQSLNQSDYHTTIIDDNIKLDYNFYLNQKSELFFGGQFLHRKFHTDLFYYDIDLDDIFTEPHKKLQYVDPISSPVVFLADEISLYLENKYTLSSHFLIHYGVRGNLFNHESFYNFSIQPRVNIIWVPDKSILANLSFTKMNQNLHNLSVSGGFPSDIWVPSNEWVKPKTSLQVSSSISKQWNESWRTSISTYYKNMENLIQLYDAAKLPGIVENDPLFWEDQVNVGLGKAYGIEMATFVSTSKWKWDISYTYSTSVRKFEGINNNQFFPDIFDQKHRMNTQANIVLNKNMSLYLSWQWNSGTPYTLFNSTVHFNPFVTDYFGLESEDDNTGHSGLINGNRLPDYHSLDFGLLIQWSRKNYSNRLAIGLNNVYDHKNVYFAYNFVDILEEKDDQLIYKTTLPLIPFFKYSIQFESSK